MTVLARTRELLEQLCSIFTYGLSVHIRGATGEPGRCRLGKRFRTSSSALPRVVSPCCFGSEYAGLREVLACLWQRDEL